jgi:adenine deaminase
MEKAELKIAGGKVINVFSHEVQERDVYVKNGMILGFGPYSYREKIDLQGAYLCPGFIESHLHVESSHLTPPAITPLLAPHGTSLVIADPHEIANVMGLEGIYYLMDISAELATDFLFMAPSCVPSSPLETSGARLELEELQALVSEQRILGLGEVMDFPGVIARKRDLMKKITLFDGRPVNGHAPGVTGVDLENYLRAGIQSDHESISYDEAKEKLDRGMFIMIREGSTARNLENLLPLVTPQRCSQFAIVSDDVHAEDLATRGHLDFMLRRCASLGLDPLLAIKMVTINPAKHFSLKQRGAVAPGYKADLAAVSNLENFEVIATFKNGRLTSKDGELLGQRGHIFAPQTGKFNIKWPESLEVKAKRGRIRVIELVPGEIFTRQVLEDPTIAGGVVIPDPTRDLLKIVVFERHRGTGHFGIGFVRGFGLKGGAIASSVAHDAHNIIAVGANDNDILIAAHEVESLGGGQVVAARGQIEAALPLPIAGLMSDGWADEVIVQRAKIVKAARTLGATIDNPFMALSFLALPTIPDLKITDLGLVDVKYIEVVPIFE